MSSKIKKYISFIGVTVFAVLLLTACGGGPGKVNVNLGVFKIDMPATVKPAR